MTKVRTFFKITLFVLISHLVHGQLLVDIQQDTLLMSAGYEFSLGQSVSTSGGLQPYSYNW